MASGLPVAAASVSSPDSLHSSEPTDADILSAPPTTNLRDKLRGSIRGGHLSVVPPAGVEEVRRTTPTPPSESPAAPRSVRESYTPPSPTGDGTITVEQLVDLWPRIRNDVKAVNRRVEALLASIDPLAVHGSQITLVAAYEFHRKRVNEDEVRRVVEDTISRIVGRTYSIVCVMRGEQAPSPPAGAGIPARPSSTSAIPAAEFSAPTSAIVESDEPSDLDKQRLLAARNIFDGEEID